VRGVVFLFHDRVQPATLRLLPHEVAPRVADL
jgi:hypothetical protein